METHLNGFGIENFRVFKEKAWLDFAPITILTGTNNSGKSSIVRAINLLGNFFEERKNNLKVPKFIPDLMDIEELLDILGDFSKLSNYNSNDGTVAFFIAINMRGILPDLKLKLDFKLQNDEFKQGKLVGISILNHIENDSVIFSCKEIEEFKYNVKINYNFFLNEYIRDSSWEETYFQNSLSTPEWLAECVKKYGIRSHALEVNKPDVTKNNPKYVRFFFEDGARMDFDKEIFAYNKKTLYSTKESLFTYYKETNDGLKKMTGEEYFNISLEEYINHEKDFLENYEINIDLVECKEMKKYSKSKEVKAEIKKELINETSEDWQYILKKKFLLDRFYPIYNPIKNIAIDNICKFQFHFTNYIMKEESPIFGQINSFAFEKFENNLIVDMLKKSNPRKYSGNENQNWVPDKIELDKSIDENSSMSMSKFFFEHFVFRNIQSSIISSFNNKKQFGNLGFVNTNNNANQRIYTLKENPILSKILKQITTAKDDMDNKDYFDFLEKYIKIFEIGTEITIERNAEGLGTHLYIVKNNKKTLLTDMGHGVSKILPIILQIVLTAIDNVEFNAILFIEEPESNLHPALQSKLADLFVEATETFNIQFVIETHSEYLIRKLQYLTTSNQSTFTAEDSVIYYLHNPENIPLGESQIKKINIMKNGNLSDDFGEGFFDEADRIAMELFLLNRNQKN